MLKKLAVKKLNFSLYFSSDFPAFYFQFGSRAVHVLNYFMPNLVYLGKCSGKSTDLLMNVNYYAGCGMNQPFCSAILAKEQTK